MTDLWHFSNVSFMSLTTPCEAFPTEAQASLAAISRSLMRVSESNFLVVMGITPKIDWLLRELSLTRFNPRQFRGCYE